MSDSATHPFRDHILITRLQGSLNVGPTHLLPCQRPHGLLRAFDIPLRTCKLSLTHPGLATRRSGASRDGTSTRKSDTARFATSDESSRRTMGHRIASYRQGCQKMPTARLCGVSPSLKKRSFSKTAGQNLANPKSNRFRVRNSHLVIQSAVKSFTRFTR